MTSSAAPPSAAPGSTRRWSGPPASRTRWGTINPTKPGSTSSIVTGGVYRVTRNPMYVGLALLLAGFALYLGNALGFLTLPAVVLYLGRFQIGPEERVLAAKFGAAYDDYRSRVRRWL